MVDWVIVFLAFILLASPKLVAPFKNSSTISNIAMSWQFPPLLRWTFVKNRILFQLDLILDYYQQTIEKHTLTTITGMPGLNDALNEWSNESFNHFAFNTPYELLLPIIANEGGCWSSYPIVVSSHMSSVASIDHSIDVIHNFYNILCWVIWTS